MREIKFRGIRERNVREREEMLYGMLNNIYPSTPFIWPSSDRGYAVRPETVGQFTGLYDKNEREIYEGDVLLCVQSCYRSDLKYEVKFGEYEQDGSGGEYSPTRCLGFYAESLEKEEKDEFDCYKIYDYEHTLSLLDIDEIEVIGNIHENSELLNG